MKALIPNLLTSLNLVFGMLSILYSTENLFIESSLCILLALVADGLDGRVARFLNVTSDIGKELDSLCDLGSFGIAPALLAYQLYLHEFGIIGGVVAIVFALCGAFRLARFNVNTDTVHGYFMGLAIPAGGCLIATSTLLIVSTGYDLAALGVIYPLLVFAVGLLMISSVHYADFKGDGERIYPLTKAICILFYMGIVYLAHTEPLYALLFAIFSTYAILGIVNHTILKIKGNS